MQNIKTAFRRFVATIALAIAARFDRGVDGVILQFNRLDSKLDRFIARQYAIVDATARAATDSLARADAVREAEELYRKKVYAREDAALNEAGRATRVRARLRDLLS